MAHPAAQRREARFRLLDRSGSTRVRRSRVAAAVAAVTVVVGAAALARPLVDVEAAVRRHDWPAALERLARRERWLPGRSAAHAFQRARILKRQDRLAEAAAALDEAARLGHDPEEVRRQRVLMTAQAGRIGTVEPELQRFLGLGLDDTFAEECYEALVKGSIACHLIDDARECLAFWRDWQPDNARAQALEGLVAERLERHGDALEAYRRALALDPRDVTVRSRVAAQEVHAGLLDAAAANYARCLADRPHDAGLLLALADCRIRTGDPAAACGLLVDALTLELSPEQASAALATLAALAAEERQVPDALALYRDAVRLDPRGITARFGYAAVLGTAGEESAAALERAEAQRLSERHRRLTALTRRAIGEPHNAELRVEIAGILRDLGLTDQGTRWLETALQIDPQHAAARRMLDDHEGGRTDGAGGDGDDTASTQGRNDA